MPEYYFSSCQCQAHIEDYDKLRDAKKKKILRDNFKRLNAIICTVLLCAIFKYFPD